MAGPSIEESDHGEEWRATFPAVSESINKEPEIPKWQKYSQNTTIFISYEWVHHIAVYNYMFRPLSAIVRLYYFLL